MEWYRPSPPSIQAQNTPVHQDHNDPRWPSQIEPSRYVSPEAEMVAKLGTYVPHACPRSIAEQQVREAFLHQEISPGMVASSQAIPSTVAPHVPYSPEDTPMWGFDVDRGDMLPQSRWPPPLSQPHDRAGNRGKTTYLVAPSLKSRISFVLSPSPSLPSQFIHEAYLQSTTSRLSPPHVEDHFPIHPRHEDTCLDDRVPGPSRYVTTAVAGYREPAPVITTSSTQYNPQTSCQVIFRQQVPPERRPRDSD